MAGSDRVKTQAPSPAKKSRMSQFTDPSDKDKQEAEDGDSSDQEDDKELVHSDKQEDKLFGHSKRVRLEVSMLKDTQDGLKELTSHSEKIVKLAAAGFNKKNTGQEKAGHTGHALRQEVSGGQVGQAQARRRLPVWQQDLRDCQCTQGHQGGRSSMVFVPVTLASVFLDLRRWIRPDLVIQLWVKQKQGGRQGRPGLGIFLEAGGGRGDKRKN